MLFFSFSFVFYLDSFSYLDYLYFTWRHYYNQFMKNNGKGNKLQKKNFNCGKEIHGQGKHNGQGNLHNGQGNLHNGQIYTSPFFIKRKGGKGGGVCVCICLFGFMCRCAHAAIGRPFSTCEKGKKTPEATSDLARIDKNRPKRSTSPGAPIVQEGWGLTYTHTHTHLGQCGRRVG